MGKNLGSVYLPYFLYFPRRRCYPSGLPVNGRQEALYTGGPLLGRIVQVFLT
jgi:hypothetical protein